MCLMKLKKKKKLVLCQKYQSVPCSVGLPSARQRDIGFGFGSKIREPPKRKKRKKGVKVSLASFNIVMCAF